MEGPTLAKYSLKELTIIIGSVTKEPFLSIIVIAFKLLGFIVTRDLIPFQIADVFFLFISKEIFIVFDFIVPLQFGNIISNYLISSLYQNNTHF